MISTDEFAAIFGIVPTGDEEGLIKVVTAAVRAGYAIVLDKPGTKIPMCTLTARDAKAADVAAQEAARAIGDERWARRRHECGLHHALTVDSLGGDPAKVATKVGALMRRLYKAYDAWPNIGVEVGRSGLLVVDVDTPTEAQGYVADFDAAHDGAGPAQVMTVESPGKQDPVTGEWIHSGGGHYWYRLPTNGSVTLPASTGAFRAESGWVAMWAGHQVLVPPSKRAEGPYLIRGNMSPAPAWLIERIRTEAVARMERARDRSTLPDGTGDIDVWSASLPWGDLLEPDGWTLTGLPSTCSCPIWTAPGAHASPKSATAHDVGCSVLNDGVGHAPLKVWTDNPPPWLAEATRQTGSTLFTRLQYLAWRDHEGVTSAVLKELGLIGKEVDEEFPGFSGNEAVYDPFVQAPESTEPAQEQAAEHEPDPFGDDGSSDFMMPSQKPVSRVEAIRAGLLDSAGLEDLPEAQPLVADFLDLDTVARVTGKSGHGKSFVMIDIAGCVATGRDWHGQKTHQGLVIYMAAEGSTGFKKRLRSWEQRWNGGERIPGSGLLILPMPVQSANSEDWTAWRTVLRELKPVLVILDTQARITVGVEENDAKDMGIFVERLEQLRRDTGACVVPVHHLGHAGEHGRGSTAVLGALGTEIRVSKPAKGQVVIHTEKQKDTEEAEPLKFRMDPEGSSVVLVPDGWEPGQDPFEKPESEGVDLTSSVRDRLAAVIWHVFSHGSGCTKAEALSVMTKGHPRFGKAGRSRLMQSWADLESDGVLQEGATATRWRLDPEEAKRLNLAAPDGIGADQSPEEGE